MQVIAIPATRYEQQQAAKRWSKLNSAHIARGKAGQLAFKPFLDGARNKLSYSADFN